MRAQASARVSFVAAAAFRGGGVDDTLTGAAGTVVITLTADRSGE